MLKTVRDACEPHRVAFDFSPSDQVEDLGQVFDDKNDWSAGQKPVPGRTSRPAPSQTPGGPDFFTTALNSRRRPGRSTTQPKPRLRRK